METLENNAILWLKRVFNIAFLGLIALILLSIFSGNDIRGVESNVIYTIQQILVDNTNLYQDPNNIPFSITQYTPLYYLICDAVLSVFNVESHNFLTIRIVSRFVSVIFAFGTGLLMYKIIKEQLMASKNMALIMVSLLIVFTFPWYTTSRPDVLVPFFLIASLYITFNYLKSKKNNLCVILGLLSFAAFASKQNGIVIPIIIGLFFLIRMDWKAIVLLISGFVIGMGILIFVLYLGSYDLTFLKENIIDGVNNNIDYLYALNRPYKGFLIYFGFFFLASIFLIINNYRRLLSIKRNAYRILLWISLLVLFLFAVITALKVGSGVNYFNELLLVLLIFWSFEYLNFDYSKVSKKIIVGFLLLVGIQVCCTHYFRYSYKIVSGINETYLSNNTSRSDVVTFLNENLKEGYFYSDDRKINMRMHDKCLLLQIDIYSASNKTEAFDITTKLKQNFNNGKIAYLVLNNQIQPILNIDISKKYKLKKTIGNFRIYNYIE